MKESGLGIVELPKALLFFRGKDNQAETLFGANGPVKLKYYCERLDEYPDGEFKIDVESRFIKVLKNGFVLSQDKNNKLYLIDSNDFSSV